LSVALNSHAIPQSVLPPPLANQSPHQINDGGN